ncbi:MAG: TSUP family transporter [Syntrophales bacterium]
MECAIVCSIALVVSASTLFSGFGLGTVLMPAFALFFPVQVAVAATAVVHLANNIFKTLLVGKKADWEVVAKFALPGALAAAAGAATLNLFAGMPSVTSYTIDGQTHDISALKLAIGVVILVFSFLEFLPRFQRLSFDRKYLPVGGIISGFFGGLSGHQGAFRSAFLIKAGMNTESFVGTGTVAAVIIDITRLFIYGLSFNFTQFRELDSGIGVNLVVASTLSAFVGAFMGSRLLKKITLKTVQLIVGILLAIVGLGMITGLL